MNTGAGIAQVHRSRRIRADEVPLHDVARRGRSGDDDAGTGVAADQVSCPRRGPADDGADRVFDCDAIAALPSTAVPAALVPM